MSEINIEYVLIRIHEELLLGNYQNANGIALAGLKEIKENPPTAFPLPTPNDRREWGNPLSTTYSFDRREEKQKEESELPIFGEWQRCPVCEGCGQILADGFTSLVYQTCPTCDGQRIIARPIITKADNQK